MALTPQRRRTGDLFRDLFELRRLGWPFGERIDGSWAPAVDVFEENGNVVIKAELPGLAKEDVKVSLEDDAVTIQGERKSESETKEDNYYLHERTVGSFYRRLPLPRTVDSGKGEAAFKDGILTVKAPAIEAAAPKSTELTIE